MIRINVLGWFKTLFRHQIAQFKAPIKKKLSQRAVAYVTLIGQLNYKFSNQSINPRINQSINNKLKDIPQDQYRRLSSNQPEN